MIIKLEVYYNNLPVYAILTLSEEFFDEWLNNECAFIEDMTGIEILNVYQDIKKKLDIRDEEDDKEIIDEFELEIREELYNYLLENNIKSYDDYYELNGFEEED